MRRTYTTLTVLATLAILAALGSAAVSSGLAYALPAHVFIAVVRIVDLRVFILVLSQVCALLVTATLALAVVVAAWAGRKGWLVALVSAGTLAVCWTAALYLVAIYLPSLLSTVYTAFYPVGALLTFAGMPVLAASLALAFATRRDSVATEPASASSARRASKAYWILAICAAAAIIASLAAVGVTRALINGSLGQFIGLAPQGIRLDGALGRMLIQTFGGLSSALTIGVVVAAIAIAVWMRRTGWVVALATVSGITLVLPALLLYSLLLSPEREIFAGLFTLLTSTYAQAVLAVAPCIVALAFALVERARTLRGVAPVS